MKTKRTTPTLLPQGTGYGRQYWTGAAAQMKDMRIIVFAALIIALRVVVKSAKIYIMPGLHLTLDCYVNALGAMVCGPVVAFLSGAVSDTLGCILFPSPEPYFFPYMFVEMLSSGIFGLFLWRKKITVSRVLLSKLAVNVVCNLIVNPAITKLYYAMLGDSGSTYAFITAVRVGKNLVLFPLEAALIVLFVSALFPLLRSEMNSTVRYADNASSAVEPVTIVARTWVRLRQPHNANSITRGIMTNNSSIFIVRSPFLSI